MMIVSSINPHGLARGGRNVKFGQHIKILKDLANKFKK
jgi:hypothetical protein